MKITDVTLTLFAWPGIPSTTYGRHTGQFGGDGQLGLLTLATDAGVEGHAFLGSAMRGAHLDGASLIEVLKPVVPGRPWNTPRSSAPAPACARRAACRPCRCRDCVPPCHCEMDTVPSATPRGSASTLTARRTG